MLNSRPSKLSARPQNTVIYAKLKSDSLSDSHIRRSPRIFTVDGAVDKVNTGSTLN